MTPILFYIFLHIPLILKYFETYFGVLSCKRFQITSQRTKTTAYRDILELFVLVFVSYLLNFIYDRQSLIAAAIAAVFIKYSAAIVLTRV